jgi:hypothetical protein
MHPFVIEGGNVEKKGEVISEMDTLLFIIISCS